MAHVEEVQSFVREYADKISPLPIDPVMLLIEWEKKRNHYKAWLADEFADLIDGADYTDPDDVLAGLIGKYVADRDDETLDKLARLVEQNVRENMVDDKFFIRTIAEVVREALELIPMPDDDGR